MTVKHQRDGLPVVGRLTRRKLTRLTPIETPQEMHPGIYYVISKSDPYEDTVYIYKENKEFIPMMTRPIKTRIPKPIKTLRGEEINKYNLTIKGKNTWFDNTFKQTIFSDMHPRSRR